MRRKGKLKGVILHLKSAVERDNRDQFEGVCACAVPVCRIR